MPTDSEHRVAFVSARYLRELESDPVIPARDYWRRVAVEVSGP